MRDIQIANEDRTRALVPTTAKPLIPWRQVRPSAVLVIPATLAVGTWLLKNRHNLAPLLKPIKWLWSRRAPKPEVPAKRPTRLVYRVMVGEVHITEQQ